MFLCAWFPLLSCTEICQLYVVPVVRLVPPGRSLLESVGSIPQVSEVIEFEKPFELELCPGISQIVFPLLSDR